MRKKITILGATGSIGRNTLNVLDSMPERFEVHALAAGQRAKDLAELANRFHANVVSLADPEGEKELRDALAEPRPKVLIGADAAKTLAAQGQADLIVCAQVGTAGVEPTLAAVEACRTVALANKEALVVAGEMITQKAQAFGTRLLPIDSEHSGVFQALRAGRKNEVQRIILTASGGPFRTCPIEKMRRATAAEALDHPTWQMGKKITIDSATMMNKALEIIEAHWLFDLPAEKIEVLIHPESLVHALVEFLDGSMIAQVGLPDMRTAIQYALTWPKRLGSDRPALDLAKIGTFHFETPDPQRCGALKLARCVIQSGGTTGAVLSGANEAAVEAFLDGKIRFGRIVPLVEQILNDHDLKTDPTLTDLLHADLWARKQVNDTITGTQ